MKKVYREQAAALLYHLEHDSQAPSDLMNLAEMYDETKLDEETLGLLEEVGHAAEELDDALTMLAQRLEEVVEGE